MSKIIRPGIAAALSALLLVLAPPPAARRASGQQSVTVAPTNTRAAAVVAATSEVLKETSEIRQLSVIRPVKSGAQSRSEIERMIIKNMDEESTPEELHASELSLKKLGLVPSDFQLRPFLIKLFTEQVAGYYDTKVQEFYLADWLDMDGQKPVMAHELTHALQDQHFSLLRRFEKWPKDDSDAEMAAHALVEGDASYVMVHYISRSPLRALAFMKSLGQNSTGSEQIDRAPRALRESLLFPYQQGMEWVMVLYKRNGWATVTQAFTDLPQSTEQILHVEKYFAREAPVKVSLGDVSGLLGPGWKRLDYDVNGEWSYFLILDQFLKAEAESRRAAAGWAGDRYAVYEGPKGEAFIAQRAVWDTERDAQEFFEAYAKRTQRRYADATESEQAGDAQATRRAWRTGEGDVFIERRGVTVLIAEGLPASADAKQLSAALWK